MKTIFILFFTLIFSIPTYAWWTQKPIPKSVVQTESNPTNRVQFALRKIHLYQQLSGQQKLIQTGSAFVLDQRHLLTSLYNVSRLGRFPDHTLYLEQNNQMSPLQLKYLDYYNGVALLYSSTLLTDLPLFSDFDFNNVTSNEPLRLMNIERKEMKVLATNILDDGMRELFQIKSSPEAPYYFAGNPILNSKNKIAGIYLGKTQGKDQEYYLPTAKLSHLFEKAKATANTAPDFAAPQRQFLNQIKAFQEKLTQSLLTEQLQQATIPLSNLRIKKLPVNLNCTELKKQALPGLRCEIKIPLMIDSYTPAFQLELIYQPLISNSSKDLAEQAQVLAEDYLNQFQTEPTCKQYRMQFKKQDTQFQFCTEASSLIENTQHSFFRAIIRPQKKESLAILFNITGLTAEQIKVLMRPLFLKAEWTGQ